MILSFVRSPRHRLCIRRSALNVAITRARGSWSWWPIPAIRKSNTNGSARLPKLSRPLHDLESAARDAGAGACLDAATLDELVSASRRCEDRYGGTAVGNRGLSVMDRRYSRYFYKRLGN